MDKILRMLNPHDVDAITIAEVRHFAEKKYDEQLKIRGKIARDLRRIGENAWQDSAAYEQLRAKYKKSWTSTKKLAILDKMQKEWCS